MYVGVEKPCYANITINPVTGHEAWGKIIPLQNLVSVNIEVEYVESSLYASNKLAKKVRKFKSGKISLNLDELSTAERHALLGETVDANGALISSIEDNPAYVAILFKSTNKVDKARCICLYKVQFSPLKVEATTIGESVEFKTPVLEGTVFARSKPDCYGRSPWKNEITEGDPGVTAKVLVDFFKTVYEPVDTAANFTALNAKLEEVRALLPNTYTASSWYSLMQAVEEGEEVATHSDALQDEINTALQILEAARAALAEV